MRPIVDENLPTDEEMVEEHWMMSLGHRRGKDWFRSWRYVMKVWCMQ